MAWFIDAWAFLHILPWLGIDSWAVALVLFVALRELLYRGSTTPGLQLLAIDIHDRVPQAIAHREDRISLGLAILAFMAGSQALSDGLAGEATIIPLFGWMADPLSFSVLWAALGVVLLACAFGVARHDVRAWAAILVVLTTWFGSCMIGATAWSVMVVESFLTRRMAMGIPIMPGEVAIMAKMAMGALTIPAAIAIVLVLARFERLKMDQVPISDETGVVRPGKESLASGLAERYPPESSELKTGNCRHNRARRLWSGALPVTQANTSPCKPHADSREQRACAAPSPSQRARDLHPERALALENSRLG